MPTKSINKPPWQRVIVVRPGCEKEIRKAGKEASKIKDPVEGKIEIDTQKHQNGVPRQEREH